MNFASDAVVTVDGCGAVIRPGILLAKANAVTIENRTDYDIKVFLPEGKTSGVLTIGTGATGTVRLEAPEGIYAFAVFSQQTGDFARGNSSPRIIIR